MVQTIVSAVLLHHYGLPILATPATLSIQAAYAKHPALDTALWPHSAFSMSAESALSYKGLQTHSSGTA